MTYRPSEASGNFEEENSAGGPPRNRENLSEIDATTTDETLTADSNSTYVSPLVATLGIRSTSAGDAD